MSELKLIEFPKSNIVSVSDSLRSLADKIDSGQYGDAHNLAWILDDGDGVVSLGLMGKAAEPGAEAYLLFGVAQQKIVNEFF